MMKSGKIKYIYILSQRYSGSTLLSFLLATNPKISTIGERRKFYVHSLTSGKDTNMRCSCGQLFRECNYWNDIKEAMMAKTNKTDLNINPTEFQLFKNKYLNKVAYEITKGSILSGIGTGPFKHKVRKLNLFNTDLVQSILELDKHEVFLDSSKSINHVLFLSLIQQFDLRVIWLTRDPRAQINSSVKYNKYTIKEATQHWIKEMKENKRVLEKLNIKYTTLQYEELCNHPDQKMRELMKFVNMEERNYSLDFRSQKQHIMGNFSMRLGNDRKIEIRNEWRDQLTEDQIAEIDHLTQAYNEYKRSK